MLVTLYCNKKRVKVWLTKETFKTMQRRTKVKTKHKLRRPMSENKRRISPECYPFSIKQWKHEALHLKMLLDKNEIKLQIQALRSTDKCQKTGCTHPVLMYEMLPKDRLLDSAERNRMWTNQPSPCDRPRAIMDINNLCVNREEASFHLGHVQNFLFPILTI